MYRIISTLFVLSLLLTGYAGSAQKNHGFQPKPALVRLIDGNLRQAANQYKVLMGKVPADRLPKTYYANTDKFETSNSGWWTSGFYPGTLLYLYEYTKDTSLLREALARLTLLEKEQYNKGTHDLGFMMYCSYGNAQRLAEHGILPKNAAAPPGQLPASYSDILLNSARSLSTRFNPKVGCIRSWDSPPWKYPVIIDNMMNLELLFWATRTSGDSSFYKIAVTHANTTMHNHYRPDYSSFHVVDYDTATGEVLAKKTAQGYADSSAWARGQAWGLYGFTVMYRSTHDPKYLDQAEHIAQFILTNPNLPADKIPYWDYNAPDIPHASKQTTGLPAEGPSSTSQRPGGTFQQTSGPLRDASAAAIMASALIELSHYATPEKGRGYLDVAEQIIVSLSSGTYKALVGSNGGFLLRHSVGHLPAKSEVDVPLTYADYYFVEAMLRYKQLGNEKSTASTGGAKAVRQPIDPTGITSPELFFSTGGQNSSVSGISPLDITAVSENSPTGFSVVNGAQPTAPRLVKVAEGWAKNSVNTVIFRHNSLITVKDTQFIAFYDGGRNLVLGKRRLGDTIWVTRITPYKGNTSDAHNAISLTADGDGYLHVSWDHHNNPLRYCRSISPGSLELTNKMPMTGNQEARVSYPEFYKLPDGDLLFLYRNGASGNGNLVIDRYDTRKKEWTSVQQDLIDGEQQRSAYWQACVDNRGALHLSWVWRESPDVASNHDICYARSRDGGRSWEKTNGEKYQLPITATTAEYAGRIPQHSELINQTSMCTDESGQPFIATYWRAAGTTVPQYQLVWHDGKNWKSQTITRRTLPFSLSGMGTKMIPISRPQILLAGKGKDQSAWLLFRDEERGDKISVAASHHFPAGEWQISDLSATAVGAWEPTYDTELWRQRQELNLFVEKVEQGDGEGLKETPPQMIAVLEWRPL